MIGCLFILRAFLCSWNSPCSLRRRKHSSPGSIASSRSSSSGHPGWRDRIARSSFWRNAADDSFAAYQEAAKVMSAKRGSASRTVSVDHIVVTGSRRATVVNTEPTSSSQGRKTRGGGVMTRVSHQSAEIGSGAPRLLFLHFCCCSTLVVCRLRCGEFLASSLVDDTRVRLGLALCPSPCGCLRSTFLQWKVLALPNISFLALIDEQGFLAGRCDPCPNLAGGLLAMFMPQFLWRCCDRGPSAA
ncbi:hypothetical protein Bca52824_033042 [Brassica carinata]|uniref:Secreted protein n=1 Tax=Brassica carinata TaxID=52824 RepID=A0A8X7SDH8_BRACI|nr:hypothetical protein Bca52824_033042 [Brassica carinata]